MKWMASWYPSIFRKEKDKRTKVERLGSSLIHWLLETGMRVGHKKLGKGLVKRQREDSLRIGVGGHLLDNN